MGLQWYNSNMSKCTGILVLTVIFLTAGCVQVKRTDYTKPLQQLTSAINGLTATIEVLEDRVERLEGKRSSDSIVISTDKSQYAGGEEIHFSIVNGTDAEIWFGGVGSSPWTTIYLEMKADGTWSEKHMFVAAPTVGDPPAQWIEKARQLNPGKSYAVSWPQQFSQYRGNDGEQAGPGTYRMKFQYYTFTPEQVRSWTQISDWDSAKEYLKTVYSNEFTIQERGVILSNNCNDYEMPMTDREFQRCSCPEGYEKFARLGGAYCATNSQKPCIAHADCPQGERCISGDGKDWFCSGQIVGCYYRNPENPDEPMLCAD